MASSETALSFEPITMDWDLHGGKKKPAQAAAPKAKRQQDTPAAPRAPRRRLAECAAGVTAERVAAATAEAEQRYAGTGDQVGHALGPVIAAFGDCSTLPQAVLSGEVDAVGALPAGVLGQLSVWLAKKDAPGTSEAVVALLRDAARSLSRNGLQLGTVVSLGVLCRCSAPAVALGWQAVLRLGPALAGAASYPLLLFVLSEMKRTAQGSQAAAGLFVRAVLPQVVGPTHAPVLLAGVGGGGEVDASTVAVCPAAVSQAFLTLALGLFRAAPATPSKTAPGLGEAVCPAGALVALALALAPPKASDPAPMPRGCRDLASQLLTVLQDGAVKKDRRALCCELVAEALAVAEKRADSINDAVLPPVARLVVAAVATCPEAGETWVSKHKAHLKGSSRLLHAMVGLRDARDPSAALLRGRGVVRVLSELSARHAKALEARASSQGKHAEKAEADICALLGTQPKAPAARGGARPAGQGPRVGGGSGGLLGPVGRLLRLAVVCAVAFAALAAVPIVLDRTRPDLLVRVVRGLRGAVGPEPVDALLSRVAELAQALGQPLTSVRVQGGRVVVS